MTVQELLDDAVNVVSGIEDSVARPDRCQVLLTDHLLDAYHRIEDPTQAESIFQVLKDVGTGSCPMGKGACPLSSYACPVRRNASCETPLLM